MNFEKSLRRLDEIIAALEGEQVGLDASLKLFEEGVELLRIERTSNVGSMGFARAISPTFRVTWRTPSDTA